MRRGNSQLATTALYEALAERYDANYARPTDVAEDQVLGQRLTAVTGTVVDLGCGTGLGLRLCNNATGYVGVDAAGAMLERLAVVAAGRPNVRLVAGDVGAAATQHAAIQAAQGLPPVGAVIALYAAQYLSLPAVLRIAETVGHPGTVLFLHGYGPRYEWREHYVGHHLRPDYRGWLTRARAFTERPGRWENVRLVGYNAAPDGLTDQMTPADAAALIASTVGIEPVEDHYNFALEATLG